MESFLPDRLMVFTRSRIPLSWLDFRFESSAFTLSSVSGALEASTNEFINFSNSFTAYPSA